MVVATFHARRLPHDHAVDRPIFLTWRLSGSLPANRNFPPATSSGQAFLAMDRLLDTAVTGPLYLRQPKLAAMVVEAIRDQAEFVRIANYIEDNPVTAGLAMAPEEFPWSSAWPITNRP
jgi:hypothetical protein